MNVLRPFFVVFVSQKFQVVVVLEAIIGRTLEQSLVEVLEEEVKLFKFI